MKKALLAATSLLALVAFGAQANDEGAKVEHKTETTTTTKTEDGKAGEGHTTKTEHKEEVKKEEHK